MKCARAVDKASRKLKLEFRLPLFHMHLWIGSATALGESYSICIRTYAAG